MFIASVGKRDWSSVGTGYFVGKLYAVALQLTPFVYRNSYKYDVPLELKNTNQTCVDTNTIPVNI